MDLFTYYRSTSSYRVRIALALKGLDYTAIPVNLSLEGGAQHTADYKDLNPQGRVPALRLDDGVIITQSLAIIEYLEERYPQPALLAQEAVMRARQRAVAALIGCDIQPLHNLSVLDRLRTLGHDEDAVLVWIRHWVGEGLQAVESLIGDHGFCFGASPGLADIYLLPQLYAAHRYHVDLTAFARIQRVERLALQHPAFQQAHPDAQSDKPE
ncbi:maleylacetoacetate isomerase [Pseudomonas congelans]|uniref:maleylacetoacetate isomerase n=1 Tax=Pseudomonas congelans TaxID=200452 RepID=UPI001BDD3880|nr:maleylacetoacetate isomerase [Pseudomonas congelans]QVX11249.1 maleylacetoacetate isomerase [Pseudomonas congelans]